MNVCASCCVTFSPLRCVLYVQTCKSYWKAWQEFEVSHGNEDTFREMLRIKRSVQAQYNTQVSECECDECECE